MRDKAFNMLTEEAFVLHRSRWAHVDAGVPFYHYSIIEACRLDPNPAKVNLGVGLYRDDQVCLSGSVQDANFILRTYSLGSVNLRTGRTAN